MTVSIWLTPAILHLVSMTVNIAFLALFPPLYTALLRRQCVQTCLSHFLSWYIALLTGVLRGRRCFSSVAPKKKNTTLHFFFFFFDGTYVKRATRQQNCVYIYIIIFLLNLFYYYCKLYRDQHQETNAVAGNPTACFLSFLRFLSPGQDDSLCEVAN